MAQEGIPAVGASLGQRYAAYWWEGPFLGPIQVPGAIVMIFQLNLDVWAPILFLFATWVVYSGLFWGFWNGQTPGMRIVGIRVVRLDGADLTIRTALVRAVCLYIGSLGGIVPISILLSGDGRGIHDHIAGTRVVTVVGEAKGLSPTSR